VDPKDHPQGQERESRQGPREIGSIGFSSCERHRRVEELDAVARVVDMNDMALSREGRAPIVLDVHRHER